jgi:predicted amidohydrolase YtcJ
MNGLISWMQFREPPIIAWGLLTIAVAFVCCGLRSSNPKDGATLILRSGTIHTMDDAATIAEAMVVRDREIIYIGDDEGARAYAGRDVEVIDLAGRAVLPGFHDTHTHLIWSGTELLNVDLFAVTTVGALAEVVHAWASQHPEAPWVRGSGWNMADFEGRLSKSQLDAVVPDRPVFLYSSDGHTAFANSVALALAGIGSDTPDPRDGRIERDAAGNPTGVLQEAAMDLVAALLPPYPRAQIDEGLANALLMANGFGITTIVDASIRDWMMAGYARAHAAGTLTMRVHGAAWVEPGDLDAPGRLEALRTRYASERIMVGSAKFFVDGIIESKTAYMLEPYTDGTNGVPIFSDEELQGMAIALDAAGFQLHAHVIGDGATRQFLDAVEAVRAANGSRDRRPLLAHLEVVDPDDLPRFGALGAYASFQPLWAHPDAYIQDLTWPLIGEERSQYLYPIGALHAAGATIVAGSDWSVSSMNPFEAIEVAVTRQDPWQAGGKVLTPQHRVDLMTALRAYTSEGAKATFSEDRVGTLEAGKRADFIIVDRDPFAIPSSELAEVRVEETWLDGERVFDRADARQAARPSGARAASRRAHGAQHACEPRTRHGF